MENVRATDEQTLKQRLQPLQHLNDAQLIQPENLWRYQPDRADFDARFGGRKEHRAIAALFARAREAVGDPSDSLYMAALADTLEKMDIQLYEHYRVLADLLLEAARRAIAAPLQGGAVYAILKGVRLTLLDGERYLPAALKALDTLPADDAFYALAQEERRRVRL